MYGINFVFFSSLKTKKFLENTPCKEGSKKACCTLFWVRDFFLVKLQYIRFPKSKVSHAAYFSQGSAIFFVTLLDYNKKITDGNKFANDIVTS